VVHFCRKRHPLTLVTCRRPFRGIMVRMDEAIRTRCCIAGGGPAGMMLALFLARMGVDAVVLEKYADFLRDFRGDTVHRSTLGKNSRSFPLAPIIDYH
jgi:NADPH-dependent 2,4-dienoyl-CoA reductase/sulfur reductase-like enzyme